MAAPYENNWEYLTAEMEWLDLLLRREVLRSRRLLAQAQQHIFKGAFISDDEVDQWLGQPAPGSHDVDDADADALLTEAAALQALIAERKQASLEGGVRLKLPQLSHLFGLTPFEERVTLICLALELDIKYERLFGYLQDDMTRKRPSIELVLSLLCRTPIERLLARQSFQPLAALFRSYILRSADTGDGSQLARTLKLDERIAGFLLETVEMDGLMSECVQLASSAPGDWQSLRLPEQSKEQLLNTARAHLQDGSGARRKLIYHFNGPSGTGRKALAAGLCGELGLPLLVLDVRQVLLRAQDFAESIRVLLRESLLRPAAIYLEHFDQLLEKDEQSVLRQGWVARAIDDFSWLTFICTRKAWEPAGLFDEHLFISTELPVPGVGARKELWETLAGGSENCAPEIDWDEVAAKFRLTPGEMKRALCAARNAAHLRGGPQATVQPDDIHHGCRSQSNRNLAALAQQLKLHYDWPDITLPPDAIAQLREICAQVKHRRMVYEVWGFEGKLSLGKGLCVLFYGPSGTGKTMAAEIVARELKLEAFKIDLSTIVSKYIGETEKNLSRIFQEAESSNAILFFDEADALFGKRSEVKDAHDRYANIEINYLLQRMEEFEGIAILATNLRNHIDEAFFRRMHFAVEFPFPEEKDRYRIWKQHFPDAAPVADDVDFDFLAHRLSITGGNIRNIAVNAAFLAAANSGQIHMEHLIRATRREYEKMGRPCTEMEFAPYRGQGVG